MTVKQKIGKLIKRLSPFSPEIHMVLRVELRAFRSRLNYRINPFKRWTIRKLAANDNINLNIGCGPFGQEGWINIDLVNLKNVSFTFDSRKKLPFNNQTVARIRVEHFFEHLNKSYEAPFFLEECKRVMKNGATLRIVVPDAEKFIVAYVENDPGVWNRLGYDMEKLPIGFDTKIAILNHIFRQEGEHKYAYDYEGLNYILSKHGFKSISKEKYGVSGDPLLIDDLENHRNYSLYVDCIK